MSIAIVPSTLDFGVVAAGYVYTLDATIVNASDCVQRVKLSLSDGITSSFNTVNLICQPVQFAPGMSLPCKIELTAEQPSSSNRYQIKVTSDHGLVISSYITAFVLPMETFKYFAKSLKLRKHGILKTGVNCVGPIVGRSPKGVFDRSFFSLAGTALTPGKSVFREALMDEDDIDDLLSLPIAFNMYYDPKKKCLVHDRELGKIVIDGTKSVKECLVMSEELRSGRAATLEKSGAYAKRTIEKLHTHLYPPPPVVEDDD